MEGYSFCYLLITSPYSVRLRPESHCAVIVPLCHLGKHLHCIGNSLCKDHLIFKRCT